MTIDVLLAVICGVICSIFYHLFAQGNLGKIDVYCAASLLVAVNFILLIAVQNGYRLNNLTDLRGQVRLVSATWTGVFGALLAIAFAMKVSDEFSRGTAISFYVVGLTTLLLWRGVACRFTSRSLRTGAFANSRAAVIAERGLSSSSLALLELGQHGFRIERTIEIAPNELSSPTLLSIIAPRLEDLVCFSRENQIEHIFLLINWNRQHAIGSILDALKILPICVHLVPDANVSHFLRFPLVSTGNTWTAELRRAPLSSVECAFKRAFDLLGAFVALFVFAPIMLLTAILIKISSPGPVFFRQTRNGFNGRAFQIFKFRTMRVMEDGPIVVQATRNDPRVTSIGKWLRRTSIDELPQLFNVMVGDMSLVGPRPHAAVHNSEYEQIIGNYAFRHHVKPGITGWAQVNGYRGETREIELMKRRVDLDLWYINNWGLGLDCLIILRTGVSLFRFSAF